MKADHKKPTWLVRVEPEGKNVDVEKDRKPWENKLLTFYIHLGFRMTNKVSMPKNWGKARKSQPFIKVHGGSAAEVF